MDRDSVEVFLPAPDECYKRLRRAEAGATESCVYCGESDPVGHIAELSAYVYETGTSSLEVRVDVESRDPREEGTTPTTAACFTMVAVDQDGNSVEVPPVVPETDRGERLVEDAPC